MTTAEIKAGQTWLVKDRGRLKSTGQISVIGFDNAGRVQIERIYTWGKIRSRRDWLTPEGLRKRYRLLHEQESLTNQ